MSKSKGSGIASNILNQKLPNTKTIWGLTKEEVELCAYLCQAFSVLEVIITMIYLIFGFKWLLNSGNSGQFLVSIILVVLSLVSMSLGFYAINYENRIGLIVLSILNLFNILMYSFVIIYATAFWDYLVLGSIVTELILILQFIITIMLLSCHMTHNEIFKKEVPNWMDKQLFPNDRSLSDESTLIYGSSLDISKENLNDNKPIKPLETDLKTTAKDNKSKEIDKQIQTNSNKNEDIPKNESNGPDSKTQTKKQTTGSKNGDNKPELFGKQITKS